MHAVHGGDFFQAIGVDFSHLERSGKVIPADVLDAWYGPPSSVIDPIREHLEWIVRTSPPTHSEGLRDSIAKHRDVSPDQVLVGPGTSTLMFEVLPRLVPSSGTMGVLDPMYGEYAHLGERVIGCTVKRFELSLTDFLVDTDSLADFAKGASVLALVNPNSPTGIGIGIDGVRSLAESLPKTIVWLDETYIDFLSHETGNNESAEQLVATHPNVVVCKSMSKFYGLSGLRVGYLLAAPALVQDWERQSPPWNVGLAGQIAAVKALEAKDYYAAMASQTIALRDVLRSRLATDLGWTVFQSHANFLLANVGSGSARQVVARAAEQDVFLRDCGSLSERFGDKFVRVSVRPAHEIDRIIAAARA